MELVSGDVCCVLTLYPIDVLYLVPGESGVKIYPFLEIGNGIGVIFDSEFASSYS